MFGENGVPLDRLSEEQLEVHLAQKNTEHIIMPAAIFGLLSVGLSASIHFSIFGIDTALHQSVIVALLFMIVAVPIAACGLRAIELGNLPISWHERPHHQHVSGIIAIAVIGGVALLIALAALLGSAGGDLNLDNRAGFIVVGIVVISIGILASISHIAAWKMWRKFSGFLGRHLFPGTRASSILKHVSRSFSKLDSWLVYAVAPAAGASLGTWYGRYAVGLGYLISCGIMAWYAPPAIGLITLFWAFLICVSITRRWAWIEQDRETTLRNPNYERNALRVGIKEDLYDEALILIVSMIFVIPLAMRCTHFMAGGEAFAGVSANDTFPNWIAFFGVELAKAIPFVDWFDIYGAEAASAITKPETSMIGSHIVFGARAVVDLLFLSTLLQALSIARRKLSHRTLFFNREINLLDHSVEKAEFHKLSKMREVHGEDNAKYIAELKRYSHYDRKRLARLRVEYEPDSLMYEIATAIREISDQQLQTSEELFLEAIFAKIPLPTVVSARLATAMADGSGLPISHLAEARERLNSVSNASKFTEIRGTIIDYLLAKPTGQERIAALRSVLVGAHSDRIQYNRSKTIPIIARSAWFDLQSLRALRTSRIKDRAKSVKASVNEALEQIKTGSIANSLESENA